MNYRGFFTKKRIIWIIIILVVISGIWFLFFRNKNNLGNVQTDFVKKQNLVETVLTTGQIVSKTNLDLGFKASGIVQQIKVSEGDKVRAGDILAILDQKEQLAALTSAKGSLASANANYAKVSSGATSEDIQVSQAAVNSAQAAYDNAKSSYNAVVDQQQTAVKNAFLAMMSTGLTANPLTSYDVTATLAISGIYAGTAQGQYTITLVNDGLGGFQYIVTGLEKDTGTVQRGFPTPLGKLGLSMTFSTTGTLSAVDVWTVAVPNTLSSSYVTYYNAYQAALQAQNAALVAALNAITSAQTALDQAKATLALKQAAARPEDIAAAAAAVTSATGQVAAAQASLENTIIRAPASGTITSVDVKVGEQATALKEALVLQDVNNLHAEANVSEANIASLEPGQTVDFTFDALGPDQHYSGKLQTINPASIVISGVVDYKITANLDAAIPEIKPGMTANLTILVAKKDNALAIPQRAVVDQGGKHYVRVIDDTKIKTYHQVEVQTGLQADGGVIEITAGLSEGQEIVTFIKQ